MPRLGSDDLAAPRREAAAYADHHGRRNPMQLSTIVMVLVFTFIVRNIFFTVSLSLVEYDMSLLFTLIHSSFSLETHTSLSIWTYYLLPSNTYYTTPFNNTTGLPRATNRNSSGQWQDARRNRRHCPQNSNRSTAKGSRAKEKCRGHANRY